MYAASACGSMSHSTSESSVTPARNGGTRGFKYLLATRQDSLTSSPSIWSDAARLESAYRLARPREVGASDGQRLTLAATWKSRSMHANPARPCSVSLMNDQRAIRRHAPPMY